MKKITLFIMSLIGVVAGYAQSAIVGNYDGSLSLSHLTGETEEVGDQVLVISETPEGSINVTFPSFKIMTGTELGELLIEGVEVTANEDGSYTLQKDPFTIAAEMTSPMGAISMSYPYSRLEGVIYAEGEAEVYVEVIQNPELGALTTATFAGLVPDNVSPIVAAYSGDLKEVYLTGEENTAADKMVVIEKETGTTANITFPSVNILGQFATGDFKIEGVSVIANEDGTYTLAKDQFDVSLSTSSGMSMSYPNSSLSGTVSAEGDVELVVNLVQNPTIPMIPTIATFTGKPMDSSIFVWGMASWNTEDGVVYEGIDAFKEAQLTLSYPNPTGFNLSFLNVLAVNYNVYVDENEEPIAAGSSAQGGTNVLVDYDFVEGHTYKLVTTGALLAQANLATRTTDTLTTDDASYEISFTINGPELQKTIDVEAYMSLAITNQEVTKTVSLVDVSEITSALGIADISEAVMRPLNVNGSYNDYVDFYDWWRDADGEFTNYNGGWDPYAGHNAYPAVYCIKLNAAADSVTYYFYDRWNESDPEEDESVPGSGMEVNKRAPVTSSNSILWNWDNGDGTTTQYKRTYRVDEGKDYQSSVMFIANNKSVILRATLHFVSIEEYENITGVEDVKVAQPTGESVYITLDGKVFTTPQKGFNIERKADGTVRKFIQK